MATQTHTSSLPLMQSLAAARSSQKSLTLAHQIALVIGGSILLALSAHVKVPFYPVPMTMQTMLVLLIGMAYGSRLGFVTIMTYLAQGAIGLPVFATGAGLAYMAGPTGGYLAGFAIAAFVVGKLAESGWGKNVATMAAAMVIGNIIIYACGVSHLSSIVGDFGRAMQLGLLPFLYGDILKIVIATGLLPLAWKLLPKS